MIPLVEIEAAAARLHDVVRHPPLHRVRAWESGRARLHVKLECWQTTGSFKFRGASHKLLVHAQLARSHGVVTASTGNHGLAVATAARRLGANATVFVPEHADASKVDAIRRAGAQVRAGGLDCVDAEACARSEAAEAGAVYVSPYNDAEVIAGQGTIGLEIEAALGRVPDCVVVALGGGGLISGVGSCLRARSDVRIVAASPERSPAMHECLQAGQLRDVPCFETLSDGTAGGVEPGSITFPLCQELVDESRLVTEEEIAVQMRAAIADEHVLIEGAAGAALAIARKEAARLDGDLVVILCGANVSTAVLRAVLA